MHRSILFSVLILLAGFAATSSASSFEVKGRVFEDRNGNDRWDRGEPGLAGIAVSDGERIVRSDSAGHWRLRLAGEPPVFVIVPDGFAVPAPIPSTPRFWTMPRRGQTMDFALTRREIPAGSRLNLLIFGDPQPKNEADVGHYARDIVDPLVGEADAALGISLGDITHGNLSLYPSLIEVTARLRTPWLHVSGNHDRDYDAPSDEASLRTFSRHFGPDSFAWEQDGVSIVVLDNVIHEPASGVPARYIGGLRESQFRFLEAYLAGLPAQRRVILAMHMPLFDSIPDPVRDSFRDADRQRLYRLLERFENRLVLSSHMHMQSHVFHDAAMGWRAGTPLHEFNVGATCGAYWSGPKDAQGVPDTLMQDGTPNGYARLHWQADQAPMLSWYIARDADNPAMVLHAPQVLRKGAFPGFAVYANVFMGRPDTRVEYRIGEGPWRAMNRVAAMDAEVLRRNLAEARQTELSMYDMTPEALPSSHLWRGSLRTDLPLGQHRIEVRAMLNGEWVSAATAYRLQSAEP